MTFDTELIAAALLLLRIIAVLLLSAVLIRQIQNLRTLQTEYPGIRMVVFLLTLTLLLGQIYPIIQDARLLFSGGINEFMNPPYIQGVAYALNNGIKDVLCGVLLCFLYFRLGKPVQNSAITDSTVPEPENTPHKDS